MHILEEEPTPLTTAEWKARNASLAETAQKEVNVEANLAAIEAARKAKQEEAKALMTQLATLTKAEVEPNLEEAKPLLTTLDKGVEAHEAFAKIQAEKAANLAEIEGASKAASTELAALLDQEIKLRRQLAELQLEAITIKVGQATDTAAAHAIAPKRSGGGD
eukprot:GHVS01098126.1.p2 GENE.GHVS01098126.1~~GHVS01098126.1.p2  ORF type:complete len:163 (+),score=33.14 GHVS01098126.1:623-1111(+)